MLEFTLTEVMGRLKSLHKKKDLSLWTLAKSEFSIFGIDIGTKVKVIVSFKPF